MIAENRKKQFLRSKKAKIDNIYFKKRKNAYIYLNYNKLNPIFAPKRYLWG